MLGGELLMALAQGQGLGGLDETARAVGVFLDIHRSLPRALLRRPAWRTSGEHPPAQNVRSDAGLGKGGLRLILRQRFQDAAGSLRPAAEAVHDQRSRENRGDLPLSGEGAVARAARPAPARRPARPLPCDRIYAIENGPSGFDPAKPGYFPSSAFLMLMRNARLAELRTRFDEASHTLTIRYENREAARGDLRTPEGRAAIERFFGRASAPTSCAGRPRCCMPPATASRTWRGRSSRSSTSPRCARAGERGRRAGPSAALPRQSHVTGWPAWHEFDLLGREIAVGRRRG